MAQSSPSEKPRYRSVIERVRPEDTSHEVPDLRERLKEKQFNNIEYDKDFNNMLNEVEQLRREQDLS